MAKSLLTDPVFLAEASAGNAANDLLNDPSFITKAVVSDRRDNDFSAGNTFIQDLKSMSYYDLGKKYGDEVRDNRGLWQKEVERQQRILDTERSGAQRVGDFSLSAGSAVTTLVGGLSSAILAIGGVADELYDPTLTGLSEEAAKVAIATGEVSTWIRSFQSKKLADRAALGAVATDLDDAESALQLEEDLAEGRNKYVAGLIRMGRDAFSAGERIMEDGALAGDIIAQGLGSILGSGKVAGAGAKLLREAAVKTGGGRVSQSIAAAAGSSAGIGLTEASGVFTQAAEEVMAMTEAELMGSPVYVAFRDEGMDHNTAQLNTSNSVAREAGIRQLPAAMTAGLLAHRFNANPLKAFRGKSFVGGLVETGKQTLEEGFQGGTGAYNVNVAIQNQVDEERSLTESVGGEVTTGAFAGFGIAGALGAPRAARNVTVGAAIGTLGAGFLIAEGVKKAATSKAAGAVGRGAIIAMDATSAGVAKVAKIAKPVTEPVAKVVVKGAKVVNKAVVEPAMQKVEDFNERPNKKLQLEVMEASEKAVEAAPDNEVIGAVDKLIKDLLVTQASKMTDEAVLDAASKIIALRKEVPKLEDGTAINVLKMLASSEFLKIQTRYGGLKKVAAAAATDLNKTQSKTTTVSKATIKETLEVAALDPAKVNPEHIGKILKSEDHGLTDDQVVLLEVAAAVATLVNTHRGEQVKVSSRESIALSKKPAYNNRDAPEVLDIEAVSRSIQIGGYKDAAGHDLRSINDFVADWIAARQSPDGTVADINEEEGSISADTLGKNFEMFVEHLRNKVAALNESFANQSKKGTGTTVLFRSIVQGNRMVNAGVAGGARGAYVHTNSPQSIANAEAVANDARVAAEAYNILVQKFPDAFPDGKVAIPTLNTTTAAEASQGTATTEAKAKPEPEVVAVEGNAEQPKQTTTTPEEDAETRKLYDDLRALKKEATVLREAKDDITEQGPELEAAFDRIAAQRKLIAAKDAEISAVYDARRDAKKKEAKENTPINAIIQKFINRLKGKKTKIVVRNTMAALASYSKSADTIYINMEKIEADFNAGLTYIEGEVEGATSAQKAKVFENIDVAAFKKYIKEGGLNRYVEFILEHELAHVVQVARGDVYPRTKAGKADLMNDAAITLERAANEAGFKAIGFDTTAVDIIKKLNKEMKALEDEMQLAVDKGATPSDLGPIFDQIEAKKKEIKAANEDTTAGDETIAPPAAIDEEAETQTKEPKIEETPPSDEVSPPVIEIQTKDDAYDADLEALNDQVVGIFVPATDKQVKGVRQVINYAAGLLGVDINKRISNIFLMEDPGFAGYAFWARGVMGFSASVLGPTDPRKTAHVISHEIAHMWDSIIGEDSKLRSVMDGRFSSGKQGDLYLEILAKIATEPELKAYFKYALNFANDAVKSQELFAELVAMYLMNPEFAQKHFPKGTAYVEDLISDHAELSQLETGEDSGSETQDESTAPSLESPPTEKFSDTFIDGEPGDLNYANGEQLLDLVDEDNNEGYLDFAKEVFQKLINGMNERLAKVATGSDDSRSIMKQIMDGDSLLHIRDFKNTMLVDPKTGQYDPELLSIAVVAMIDWMSSVRSADPHSNQLKKTLELLGVNIHDLNDVDMFNILNGVSPRFVSEVLSRRIIKMWGKKVNKQGQMVDARGAVEGLVKEMIVVLATTTDYISLHEIPTMTGKGKKKKAGHTPTINVKRLRKVQKDIGLLGQDAVQRMLTPEDNNGPSIGKRIDYVPKKNRHGTVNLSKQERRALRAEQDVPHRLANAITGLVGVLGFEFYKKMLGFRDTDYLGKNHPLRNSINGKNLSIERDWDDAHAVVDALQTQQDTPVFFRINITKAGRHQHSGINVQNNKVLRVLVSAANEFLDMTNQDHIDGFWLTVAQASGLYKVENVLHEKILSEVQDAFAAKYGDAAKLIEGYLETGKIDSDALFEATGEISMEQLNSIFAVADLNFQSRTTNALTSFHTTLGFELDGKTDGPSHMMNNFGQGLLTPEDYKNFKRVGYFLGTVKETLNSFFSNESNKDLYNEASVQGMNMMYSEMANAAPAERAALYASARFAERFGDFVLGPDGLPEMSRDTLKNPMTKTVYGSGLFTVARGIAEDMVMGFYKQATKMPKGAKPAEYFGYPDFEADFFLLFGTKYPNGVNWTQSIIDKKGMDFFSAIVVEGIGAMIANSSKMVIGRPVTKVADLLVFITNVQTEFMKLKYNKALLEMAETRAKEGKIGRVRLKKDPKDGSANTGPGIQRQLSVEDFAELKESIKGYGPTYDNGVQTLAVGAFSPQPSDQVLSSTMEGKLNMKSTMEQPEDASVKVIPYLTQGRGDAMVVNTIFGEKNPPEDMVAVHDGFYVPISKIKEYSRMVNAAVQKVWDRDVIGDTVTDFESFLGKIDKADALMLRQAFATTKAKPYDTTVKARGTFDLMRTLKGYHRGNQARKTVFKVIPTGVDHLGGAEEAALRNENKPEVDFDEINLLIGAEMGLDALDVQRAEPGEDPAELDQAAQINHTNRLKAAAGMRTATNEAAEKDNTQITLPKGIMITDTRTIMDRLMRSSNRLTIKRAVKMLDVFMNNENYKVIFGGMGIDLLAYYDEVNGEGAAKKQGITLKNMPRGWIDVDTQTLWTTSENHEILVHEMIHLVTYQAMLAHYDGSKTNDAVTRLETLMDEFMAIDYSNKGKTLRQAVNAAKAAILMNQTDNTPSGKAAALNEFIAWTLSNAALTKDLKTRDTILVRMAKAVKILIKRMLGDKIPSDMYTHILFNTVLLHAKWAEVQTKEVAFQENNEALFEQDEINQREGNDPFTNQPIEDAIPPSVGDGGNTDGVDNDNNGNGDDAGRGNGDGGVTPQVEKKTNFWIDLMRKKLADIFALDAGDPTRGPKVTQFRRYRDTAKNALVKLDFGGFIMSEYEKHTFRSIHMVLATEMRLNTQSSTALNQMYEHITTNLKPKMLGKGKQGQELYATIMDLLGDTKNDEGVSDAMAVFLALSQTSKVFRAALDQIPDPTKETAIDGSLNGFLTTITGMMMNKALGTINIADSGAKELLDTLADNLIREDTEREYTLLRALMGSLDKADKFMNGALNELAERAAAVDTRMKDEDRAALTRAVTSTFAVATSFLSADRASILAEGAKRITHMGVVLDHAVFLREFVTEVVGADSTNSEVMMMLDRTNYAIQAIRQNFKEQLPVIMQNAFETHPDEVQWRAFHKVLGGLDFAHLFDVSNPERAFNLLKDPSLLSSKTAESEAKIVAHFSKSTSDNILEKSKQLAGVMNKKGPGFQILWNAYAINRLSGDFDPKMTKEIDTLVSLYALEIADQADKDTVIEMYENDPTAVQNLVTYIQALNKEEELKEHSDGARMQGRKGWIPDHGKKNAQLVIQRDDKGDQMIKMGYVRVGDVIADKAFSTVKRGYYATTVRQGTAYSQGVLQSVQGTYRGVNAVTGIAVTPDVSGVITGSVLSVITGNLNKAGKVSDEKEVLAPVHDEDGKVWAYERIINPDLMEKYTQPKSNMALMLGAWAGRQVEEKLASQYNYELISELKRIWDERKSNDDDLFIDVSDPDLKDAVYKESWRVISPDTRNQIEEIFGEGEGFMVQKSMMNLALGYSDPTIMDVWTGKTRMPKGVQKVIQAGAKAVMGNKAVTIMSRTEEGVQGAVAKAKDIIVVRSLIVPYMNTQANVFQLLTRGVPLKTMQRGYVDKMAELERFNENTMRLMEIQTNIALAGKDKNQVRILESQAQVIEDENLRMSIAPLIAAGQYKNISEGITELDVELTTGRMAEWIENQVNKLPSKLQTITKYGLLSKDTAIYKMANKAVQYGDFLAKAIYYDHLTKVKGLSGEAALKQIQEEYVNFSILPGRTRSALESVGGTWFMSFKIRTMKVALNVMRENPARALILMASGIGEFGSPTNDNLGTVILQEGRFDYAIGWSMLLGSPELNPWAQLWGWS